MSHNTFFDHWPALPTYLPISSDATGPLKTGMSRDQPCTAARLLCVRLARTAPTLTIYELSELCCSARFATSGRRPRSARSARSPTIAALPTTDPALLMPSRPRGSVSLRRALGEVFGLRGWGGGGEAGPHVE
jgi:hypothetical protein